MTSPPTRNDQQRHDAWFVKRFGVDSEVTHKVGHFFVGLAAGLALPWLLPVHGTLQFTIAATCATYCLINLIGLLDTRVLRRVGAGVRAHTTAWILYAAFLAVLTCILLAVVTVIVRAIWPAS